MVASTKKAYEYLEFRSSKQISFSFKYSQQEIFANLNEELYSWVIENLIKNSVDATMGKGKLSIGITAELNKLKFQITDSGRGIAKSKFKKIFKPGYTTKKRGWGLGLSLSKRIIEDYHNGKILVKSSAINKGTIFEITLDKVS